MLPFVFLLSVQHQPPPAAWLAALDAAVGLDEIVVVTDSLGPEFGPGVPVRRASKIRLSPSVRQALQSRGVAIDSECEGADCAFVTFQSARDSGGVHLIRTATYRRTLPSAWYTRVVEHNVLCDGENMCSVVSSRDLAYGHQHDVQEYLRLRCPVMLASADSAVASHWREACHYRREPRERTK
jgi:hypothetical protein